MHVVFVISDVESAAVAEKSKYNCGLTNIGSVSPSMSLELTRQIGIIGDFSLLPTHGPDILNTQLPSLHQRELSRLLSPAFLPASQWEGCREGWALLSESHHFPQART